MKILSYSVAIFLFIQLVATIFYIPRIKLWFVGLKKQKKFVRKEKAKFAVIVAARDESLIISRLFKSIIAQTYPKDKFDVHIIVADKNDKTIKIANEMLANAKIYVLENQKRKAEALDYCFKQILANKDYDYDDYIVVDADNVLTPNFLDEMNNALESGAEIIIPRKTPLNREQKNRKLRTIYTDCSAATYPGLDAMGNKGKCKKNHLLNLCGQGMLIKSSIIKDLNGYPFRGLIEDYEIAVECIRKGYHHFYYEYAVIYSEEPVTRKEYNKRRVRWIKGFAQFNSAYGKEIAKIIKQDKLKRKQTYFFRCALYPVYVMFVVDVVGILFYLVMAIVMQSYIPLFFALGAFAYTYLQLFVYGFVTLFEDRDINKMTFFERVRFAVLSPLITMDYIWIFVVAFATTKDFTIWEPVKRLEM